MNTNLKKAKELLETEGYTCVLHNGEVMLTSNLRGVKPLADWYTDGLKFQDILLQTGLWEKRPHFYMLS